MKTNNTTIEQNGLTFKVTKSIGGNGYNIALPGGCSVWMQTIEAAREYIAKEYGNTYAADYTEPTNTPATMNTNETIANTPANLAKLHALATAGTPMFYIWLDAVDDAATTSVYLTEEAARADIARLEADDKEAGIYEPDAYRIINAAPYFA